MKIKGALTAVAILFSGICVACPSWQASVENDQAAGWDYQLNPQDITIVSDPKDNKKLVTKLTITPNSSWPNGHTRTEVKHNGCKTKEKDDTYFSWEFYLDQPIKTYNNIAYWETNKTYQQSMGFYLQPKTSEPNTTELYFYTSLQKRKIQWKESIEIKKWNKVDMAITWSKHQQRGRISVWLNHKAMLTQLAVKTKPDANQLFIQLGLHRNQSEAVMDTIYLSHAKEVGSLAQLLVK